MDHGSRERPSGPVPVSAEDFRRLARRRLPRFLFDYLDGGAGDEATLRANEAAFADLAFRPRVLRDVRTRVLRRTVLGESLDLPLALAPVGLAGAYRRRGEAQAARAAAAAGVPFCESTVSICGLEEVARSAGRAPWFQLYLLRDRGCAADLLAQAEAAGVTVLLLTVDLPVVAARRRDLRHGLEGRHSAATALHRAWDLARHPAWLLDVGLRGRPLTFGNLERAVPGASRPEAFKAWVDAQFDPGLTWNDLAWVRSHWRGKLVLKGILDPEDAREAVRHGADGIVVSNHGGRQLDGSPAALRALPAVVQAAGGDLEVLLDGGVRSGLDVAKALALGARACLLGRPWAWALAARGERGVADLLGSLRSELSLALGLLGLTDVADLGTDALWPRP